MTVAITLVKAFAGVWCGLSFLLCGAYVALAWVRGRKKKKA